MRRFLIVTASLLPLAACNSQPSVTAQNASIAEVTAKARDAAKIEPGKWRTTMSLASVDMPGMPPQMADMMKKRMAATSSKTSDTCITPEMANRPPGEMLGGAGDSCRYETFTMAGGRLDAVMVCKDPARPGEMRMTVAGNYGGSRYDLTSAMAMDMPGAGKMTMKANIKGARIGACDAPPG